MAMNSTQLADEIRQAMGFPTPVSAQLTGWATGIIGEITSFAIVTNAAGTITGTVPPPGGALTSGAGSGGLITGLVGARLASSVASFAGYPFVSAQLLAMCTQIALHVMTGLVTFSSGDITGVCTNTTLTPGTLTGGAGVNGFTSGLSGPTLATLVHNAVGYPGSVSTRLTQFCTAVVDHIMTNSTATYLSGSVTGVCPAGGGSLAAGAGAGGKIA